MTSLYRSGNNSEELPSYVLHAIHHQQHISERLISWTLLVVVLLFTSLYLISPTAFTDTTGLTPVPWALASYLVFAILRLYLAYKIDLPAWFLFLSIFLDIFLLMSLMWSFHIQYDQPSAFYLKSPTLLYVFIFIAARALRFEAKYVFVTGMLAATAWLVMLIYAIHDSPHEAVTHDYVVYLTSNSILVNGEIDKILTIIIVTIILTIAVIRARRLLTQAVEETIAIDELSKFFPPEVATSIIGAHEALQPGKAELRDVAMMHCDIRGFSNLLVRSTPQEIMDLITEYQAIIIDIIRKHDGAVDKFLGDGILASFNALHLTSNFSSCALSAAYEIEEKINNWNDLRRENGRPIVYIGISVAVGTALLGVVGDNDRMEYTVIGDPVNLVAKLDKHTKVLNCTILTTKEAAMKAISEGFKPREEIIYYDQQEISNLDRKIDLAVLK